MRVGQLGCLVASGSDLEVEGQEKEGGRWDCAVTVGKTVAAGKRTAVHSPDHLPGSTVFGEGHHIATLHAVERRHAASHHSAIDYLHTARNRLGVHSEDHYRMTVSVGAVVVVLEDTVE